VSSQALPSVKNILEVDAAYQRGVKRKQLRTIAPKRFNPEGKSWLPVVHMERAGWHFTAMFSNTARAHELNKTGDWVVIYFERNGHENRTTVVTEHQGPLKGRRVVRGREKECLNFYEHHATLPRA
jgi:putative hydrolase